MPLPVTGGVTDMSTAASCHRPHPWRITHASVCVDANMRSQAAAACCCGRLCTLRLGHDSHLHPSSAQLSAVECNEPKCACRPLLHAVVGGYASHAWGIEIDRVKCDKGNAFMRYAAAEMAKRNAAWGGFDVPSIRCAPIEEVSSHPLTSAEPACPVATGAELSFTLPCQNALKHPSAGMLPRD